MDSSCPPIHINKDFLTKLEIFKILIYQYEDEIYCDIIKIALLGKYLKTKEDIIKNGSDRNRLGDNI